MDLYLNEPTLKNFQRIFESNFLNIKMETVILFAFNRPNQILQAILSVNKNFSNHRPYIKVYLDEAKKNSPHLLIT